MSDADKIVEAIGRDIFDWLSTEFSHDTTMKDFPDEILRRVVSVDIATRDYSLHPGALTAIAVITFAYKLAGRRQMAAFGGKDILLLKVLAEREQERREGRERDAGSFWNLPVVELITGQVGDRIRAMRSMVGP